MSYCYVGIINVLIIYFQFQFLLASNYLSFQKFMCYHGSLFRLGPTGRLCSIVEMKMIKMLSYVTNNSCFISMVDWRLVRRRIRHIFVSIFSRFFDLFDIVSFPDSK